MSGIFDKLASKLEQKGVVATDGSKEYGHKKPVDNKGGDIADKFFRKVKAEAGYRTDMQLLDAKNVDKNAANVLFAYDPGLGPLTVADVVAYFDRHFNSTPVEVVAETANLHPRSNTVSVIVKRIVPTRPITDSQNMKKITASTFLDTTIGEIWEVDERDGQQFLRKVIEDDITQSALNRIQKIKAPVRATLASVRVEAGLDINSGDVVRFYADGKTLSGTVKRVSSDKVSIKGNDGKSYTVPSEAVFYRSEMGNASKKELSKEAYDYYKDVYGPEYAKELSEFK